MNNIPRVKNSPFRQEIKFSDVLGLILSKLPIILLASIVCCVSSFAITKYYIEPKYETYVTMYVYNNPDQVTTSGTVNPSDLQAAENLAQTYKVILSSNVVLDSVIKEVGKSYDVKISRSQLKKYVDVETVDETQLLEVSVTTTDPNLSYRIAHSYEEVAPIEIVRVTKAGGVEVVDSAEVASAPSSPNVVLNSIYGFVAGAMLSFIIFLIKMLTDNTICTEEDIEAIADISILGTIPLIEQTKTKDKSYHISNGGTLSYEEKAKSENNFKKAEIDSKKQSLYQL